jgi:Na+/melibiose symporter-like transporter
LGFLPGDTHQELVAYFEGIETGKFLFFIIIMCLKGSAIGALSALPSAMAADVVDVDTATTGEQRAGAYFSIWSMVRKAAYALGVTIGLSMAVYFGFDSLADPRATTNSEFTLIMVACIYSVIPAMFQFIGMPLLWIYPLTEAKVKEIQAKITARQNRLEQ